MIHPFSLRRLERFMAINESKSLNEEFDIPNKNLNINISRTQPEEFILSVEFKVKNKPINFNILPDEINNIVNKFNEIKIVLTFKIILSDAHPFKAPIWSLENIWHNIDTHVDLKSYYEDILANRNELYETAWSPAISIGKEVLDFIQRINHFETIVYNY